MKIAQAAALTEVAPSTLRYYEEIGVIIPIQRGDRNNRNYTEDDIERIQLIKCLRKAGIPLATLKIYNDMYRKEGRTIEAREKILLKEKENLLSKRKEIDESISRVNEALQIVSKA